MFGVIDCGTTNTRVYIIDNNLKVIGKSSKKIGVRDTAITGSKNALKEGIKEVFLSAVINAGVELKDINFALASGMITSEIGLIDLPHLIAPVGLDELSENIKIVRDKEIFPLDIPVVFVRGIKNNYGSINVEGIRKIDFMRGEETQIIGLMDSFEMSLPLNVIVLSSHTKLIHVNKNKKIEGSITTISGQAYEAINKETFIGKCIKKEENIDQPDFFSDEILKIAYDSVCNAGFLRTMIMPRFMQNLLETKWYERKFFVDCTIAVEDIRILKEAKDFLSYDLNTDYVLIGHKERCKIYKKLIKMLLGNNIKVKSICDKNEIDMLAINGAIKIMKKSKYI